MDNDTKKDVELFSLLVSEINISKYTQAEFRKIVNEIYWDIFYSLNTGEDNE
jgi:hypothetical protein